MAEYGAHLTSAASEEGERPSFFEVLAQESLMSTLRPALKHIIRILAEGNPYRFGWLYRHAEELYTGVDLILQHHFIRTTSASFAENFYGLKRVPAGSTKAFDTFAGLPSKEYIKSLLMLVVVPYLKIKLDALFERWQQQAWDQQSSRQMTWRQRIQRTFLTIYPFLHMTWEGVILAYQFRYLFHKSDCHSPYLHISGVRLKYLSKEDILQQSQTAASIPNEILEHSNWRQFIFHYLQKGIGALAIAVSQGLSLGVFFLQFLEWWYMSESYQTQMAVTSLPIPTPPKIDGELIDGDTSPSSDNICPLCNKMRTNDTALATSGYVFCYPCIFSHIKSHRCCPITSYPSETSHLVKLYPPDG